MFRKFTFILLAVSMLAAFVACGQTATTGGQASKPAKLVIAYLPNEADEKLAEDRHAIQKDMEAALGIKIEEFLASDYNGAIEAMRTGKADIANFGPLSFVQAHERANAEALVSPALDKDKEKCGYYSYIITQANNSKINSINRSERHQICLCRREFDLRQSCSGISDNQGYV